MILLNGQRYIIDTPFIVDGVQYPANWFRLASWPMREALGFSEVPDEEAYDTRFYSKDSQTGQIAQHPMQQCRDVVANELADIRWNKETQGIIYANSVFDTDNQSKVNYIGALLNAQANPSYTVIWKAKEASNNEPKFITLNASDIITIVGSGMHYISECFNREANLKSQIIAANTLPELLAIDLQSGWPSRIYG